MNQNFTTKLKDNICRSCGCEEPRLIHNIWYQKKVQRLCTSCVLFKCKEYFCPTCFGVHGLISEGKLVNCKRCKSNSHPACFSSNPNSSMCLSCIDPKRLIFDPKRLKLGGVNGNFCKGMDLNLSVLLLTATKVGCMLMCGALEEKSYDAVVKVLDAVDELKKGKSGVNHAMKDHDLKNKDRNVESFFDFSNSEDEYDDSSCETLSDDGRMQRLTIEGEVSEAVPKEIDLNEECT